MRTTYGLLGALIIVATTSCGGGGSAGPPPPPPPPPPTCPANTFCMASTTFTPPSRTVSRGTTVTWQNESGVTHNVTWDDAAGSTAAAAGDGTGTIDDFSSGTHTRVFNTPGTYGFHCTIHAPGMKGTLTVN